jgi:serine/threonine-protein kinase HipA
VVRRDHRFGALGISSSFEKYLPYHEPPLLRLESLTEAAELIARVLERDKLNERERQLIASSASMGGAHPKLLISDQGREWIAKFPKGNNVDQLLIEHASMELARRAGLKVAASSVVLSGVDHVLLVERFDRKVDGSRVHAVSAKTMLAGEPDDSYASISSIIRRCGRSKEVKEQQKELFRRMAFNIMIDNTDDHTKNHAFLMDDDGTWELSPAYDIPTQMNGLGFQAIQISPDRKHQNNFSIDHAIAVSAHFGMTAEEARHEWNCIAGWTAEWRTLFADCGVMENDLDYLADFLDAPAMQQHRLNAIEPDLGGNSCRP